MAWCCFRRPALPHFALASCSLPSDGSSQLLRVSLLLLLHPRTQVAKVVYFLKIVSVFIAILFVDAFRTAYMVTLKPEQEKFGSGLDG